MERKPDVEECLERSEEQNFLVRRDAVRYPPDSFVPKRDDRQKIELNVEILEGHLGCMKSTHSMNAATWRR